MSDGSIPLSDAVRIRLERTAGPVQYSDLRAHLERDAVFVVADSLSLIACGVAVAVDDVEAVRGFIEAGTLRKPSHDERETWARVGGAWHAVVVQPFVLIQGSAQRENK